MDDNADMMRVLNSVNTAAVYDGKDEKGIRFAVSDPRYADFRFHISQEQWENMGSPGTFPVTLDPDVPQSS